MNRSEIIGMTVASIFFVLTLLGCLAAALYLTVKLGWAI